MHFMNESRRFLPKDSFSWVFSHPVFILIHRRDEASMRPKHEFIPKKLEDIIHLEHSGSGDENVNGASIFHVPTPRPKSVPVTSSMNSLNPNAHKNGTHSFHSHTPYSQSLLDISPPSTVAPALPSFTPTFSSHMPHSTSNMSFSTSHMPAPAPSLNYDPFDPWATMPTQPQPAGLRPLPSLEGKS